MKSCKICIEDLARIILYIEESARDVDFEEKMVMLGQSTNFTLGKLVGQACGAEAALQFLRVSPADLRLAYELAEKMKTEVPSE